MRETESGENEDHKQPIDGLIGLLCAVRRRSISDGDASVQNQRPVTPSAADREMMNVF